MNVIKWFIATALYFGVCSVAVIKTVNISQIEMFTLMVGFGYIGLILSIMTFKIQE